MTVYELENSRRRWETIKNAKRRRNGGKPALTLADLQGLEDWEDAPGGIPFTVGEAKRWLEFGAKLRERFPGEETLDDIAGRLLQAERADAKIREYLETANEKKRRANSFTDVFGNRRRNIFDACPQEMPGVWDAPATRTNAEPPRWTPERRVWG